MRKLLFFILCVLCTNAINAKKANPAPLMRNVSCPYAVTDGLQDRHIALWASHGLYWNADESRWKFQRAHIWTTVEDVFSSSFTAPYLVPMLENAGAVVMQPRAYVRPGYRSVYIRWAKTKKQPTTVTLHHGNQDTQYEINTTIGEGLWHYLCTVDNGASEHSDNCTIDGEGVEMRIIDEHTLGKSGRPMWMEAARYWLPEMGITDAAWIRDTTYTDYLNDIVCRGGWVNYLCGKSKVNPKMEGVGIPVDMCLAFHTDAGTTMTDSLVGSLAIYTNHNRLGKKTYPTKESRCISRDLADSVLTQVVADLSRTYSLEWPKRAIRQANYGETRDPEVPTIILELLSHQNYADMSHALNPSFRFTAARAVYKGIGRFLAARRHTTFTPQPLPPTALRTDLAGDSLRLTWQAVLDSLEPTAAPTYFIIYTRENEGAWDNGTLILNSSLTIHPTVGVQYDFCVAAGNAGGISMRSPIVSACRLDSVSPMLIVDAFAEVRGPKMMAFDSLTGGIIPGSRPIPDGYEMAYTGEQINYDRRDPWHTDDDCGFGMSSLQRAGQLLVGNTHDWSAQHGRLLRQMGKSYVSCMEAALLPSDSAFEVVDIILGKSDTSVVHRMNTTIEQMRWTEGRHRVVMSGSAVGYPSRACYSGQIQTLDNQIITFRQELNSERLSAEGVSAVSKLSSSDVIWGRYSDTGLPAGIVNTNYAIFGFPLETLDNFNSIYQQIIFQL